MNCEVCQQPIPAERLEALPETTTCVKCSRVKAKVCLPLYSHKTAAELVVIDAEDTEAVRLARRAHYRSR